MKLRVAVLIRALLVVGVLMMNFVAAPKVSAAEACQDCKRCWLFYSCCRTGTKYSTCREAGGSSWSPKCWVRPCGGFDDEGEEEEADAEGDGDEEMAL